RDRKAKRIILTSHHDIVAPHPHTLTILKRPGDGHLINTASIRKSHTVFDAALNRTDALPLQTGHGGPIALAGPFALPARLVSASLRVCQIVLGLRSVHVLVINAPI